jgi:putative tryptophan/tyrosine transport system substrate-binding protein
MNRRAFVRTFACSLFAAPLAAQAQQASRVFRLGALSLGAPPSTGTYDARRDVIVVLRDLGYVEGRNLAVERRYADGFVERLSVLAVELVQRHVEPG